MEDSSRLRLRGAEGRVVEGLLAVHQGRVGRGPHCSCLGGLFCSAESEKRFMRPLQIKPDDFSAHVGFAHLLSNTGRFQDALHQIELAMALQNRHHHWRGH